uniref:Uncharacterized protein n=1 Tax=Rhizophora mucronata TaxID=61149 RepID=A0A2P2QDA8_RHIMU
MKVIPGFSEVQTSIIRDQPDIHHYRPTNESPLGKASACENAG